MKKKYFLSVLFMIIIIIFIYVPNVFAVKSEVDIKLYDFAKVSTFGPAIDTEEKREALEKLKTVFGYTGDSFPQGSNTMKFDTNIYLFEQYESGNSTKKYKIQIGGGAKDTKEKTGIVIKNVTEDELINTYGYNKNSNNDSWKVILIGSLLTEVKDRGNTTYYDVDVVAKGLYAGNDYEEGQNFTLNTGDNVEELDVVTGDDVVEAAEEVIDEVTDLFGHLAIKLVELIRLPFDAIQSIIDMFQTVNYGTSKWFLPWKISFTKDELLNDSDKNQYTNYTEGNTNLGSNGQKKVFLNEKESGLEIKLFTNLFFHKEVMFPVIPVDLYSFANSKIDFFDVNFLNGQENKDIHGSRSIWIIIRNFVAVLMHSVIYIGASVLIGTLIIHGIAIVKQIYIKKEEETPEEKKKHIDGIHAFVKSLMLLIGSVIIMGLCIFISNALFDDMKVTDTMELPIRVNVGERK